MEDSNGQLFVYGSLRKGFHHPAYGYISRYFSPVAAEARVKGTLYDMGEYPAAIPSNDSHSLIGELYRINNPDEFSWAMAQLDDYEGLNVEAGEQPLYRRDQVTVYTASGETRAWIYWFNGDTAGYPVLENGDVLAYLHQKNKS